MEAIGALILPTLALLMLGYAAGFAWIVFRVGRARTRREPIAGSST